MFYSYWDHSNLCLNAAMPRAGQMGEEKLAELEAMMAQGASLRCLGFEIHIASRNKLSFTFKRHHEQVYG